MSDKTLREFGKKNTVSKTGQTTSYTAYDDGYYEAGDPSIPHLIDNGDGTVSDRVTGLQWVRHPEGAGMPVSLNFDQWLNYCEGLTYAGFSDWRMPNIKELNSIQDYSQSGQLFFGPFVIADRLTLSSTTLNRSSSYMYCVTQSDGEHQIQPKTNNGQCLPVRGGI